MSWFVAGAIPPWGWVIMACLACLAVLGTRIGLLTGREQGYDAAEEDLERKRAMARRTHPVYRQRPPELHNELSPGAWIEAAPAYESDEEWMARSFADLHAFIDGLVAEAPVPYSADELWDRQ